MSTLRFPAALALAASLMLPSLSAGAATVACTVNVANCTAAIDGYLPPEGEPWWSNAALWTTMTDSVTVDLGAATYVSGLTFAVDNNDTYLFESSLDGSHWSTMLTVYDHQGSIYSGQDTFSTLVGHSQYDASLGFTAGTARYLRVSAIGGDSWNSVGEISVGVTAVPEPSSVALMLGGLALLGGAARRRRAG